jgi:predicted ABC-type ATPase
MGTVRKSPDVYVIAGPNGAGKTTFAREFLPHYVKCLEFVNADLIADGLSPFSPNRAAIRAGRIMLEQIQTFSSQSRDFGFESTLSGRSYMKVLGDLKDMGYRIHLFFLWISNPELAIERIANRVIAGGHDISESVVRRRFDRSIENFLRLYMPISDSWAVYDNSTDVPRLVAFAEEGNIRIIDHEVFGMLRQHEEQK